MRLVSTRPGTLPNRRATHGKPLEPIIADNPKHRFHNPSGSVEVRQRLPKGDIGSGDKHVRGGRKAQVPEYVVALATIFLRALAFFA